MLRPQTFAITIVYARGNIGAPFHLSFPSPSLFFVFIPR